MVVIRSTVSRASAAVISCSLLKLIKSRRAGQYRWSKWASATPGGSDSLDHLTSDIGTAVLSSFLGMMPHRSMCLRVARSGWRYRVHSVPIVTYMVVFQCSPRRGYGQQRQSMLDDSPQHRAPWRRSRFLAGME